jgi:hypothetical protein
LALARDAAVRLAVSADHARRVQPSGIGRAGAHGRTGEAAP